MCRGVVRELRDRSADEIDGFLVRTDLMSYDTEHVQCIEKRRDSHEHFAILRFGLSEF